MTRTNTTRLGVENLEPRLTPAFVVPAMQSLPGSPYSVYLDFDGMTTDDWGDYEPGVTPGFSLDADTTNTTYDEYAAMVMVFEYVAEDFAPFNINVTTVSPRPGWSPHEDEGVRVVIGGSMTDWYRDSAWGVAYLDDFWEDSRPKAFVFAEDIVAGSSADRVAKNIADVASHEAGHTLGLRHQSTYGRLQAQDYKLVAEYSQGVTLANGERVAPIMGSPYDARSTWAHGTYDQGDRVSYLRKQDDMAVLGGRLGWRADEATRNLGAVVPGQSPWASGVVGTTADTDAFLFTHPGGLLTLKVTPRLHDHPSYPQVANLDATASLLALTNRGRLVPVAQFAPDTSLGVSATVGLPGAGTPVAGSSGEWLTGQYMLSVGSHGRYGDVGRYEVKLRHGLPPTTTAASAAAAPAADGPRVPVYEPRTPAAGIAPAPTAAATPANTPTLKPGGVTAPPKPLFALPPGVEKELLTMPGVFVG